MVFIIGEWLMCDVKMWFFGVGIKNLSQGEKCTFLKTVGESLVHRECPFTAGAANFAGTQVEQILSVASI